MFPSSVFLIRLSLIKNKDGCALAAHDKDERIHSCRNIRRNGINLHKEERTMNLFKEQEKISYLIAILDVLDRWSGERSWYVSIGGEREDNTP